MQPYRWTITKIVATRWEGREGEGGKKRGRGGEGRERRGREGDGCPFSNS